MPPRERPRAFFDGSLVRDVLRVLHEVAQGRALVELDVVMCRKLVHVDRSQRERALGLFTRSLAPGGILRLGPRGSQRLASAERRDDAEANLPRCVGGGP